MNYIKILTSFKICFILILTGNLGQAQKATTSEEQVVLNKTVDYINKTIDGLLFAHRLFENYNQEVNKYIDVASHQLNPISNADLPGDIFASEWFYQPTPQDLYRSIVQEQGSLQEPLRGKLLQALQNIQAKNARINAIRFEIAQFLNDNDLNDRQNLSAIYVDLEEVVDLYTNIYGLTQEVHNLINNHKKSQYSFSDAYNTLDQLHEVTYNALLHLRQANEEGIQSGLNELENAIGTIEQVALADILRSNPSPKAQKLWQSILKKSKALESSLDQALGSGGVPPEYQPQGRYYYYYNYISLFHLNTAGPGLAADINALIDEASLQGVYVEELPHYFKVVYPRKMEKTELLPSQATEPIITELPKYDENREVVLVNKRVKADVKSFTIEVYDHMIEDGDIISLKFNDQWIVEKQELKKKPIKITLDLNTEGKNYLLLHAENVGVRPPNTIAITYSAFGKKERIILESDFDTSEMIEIDYIQ